MRELFKTIPTSLPPKNLYDYKTKYQTTFKVVVGKWYIYKINVKLPPIKRRRLIKNDTTKEEKPRKTFVREMIIVMIIGSNFIGTILNGYT